MKKSLLRVIAAVAVLTPAISAHASLLNYNEQFDGNGMHFNLNFQASDTGTTVITTFNGTAGTDPLALIAPGGRDNDNVFVPATFATTGGWNSNGLAFHDTVSGYNFQLFYGYGYNPATGQLGNLLQFNSDMPQADTFANFTYSSSPVSSVPVPAAVWLFASGLGLLTVGRRKKMV